MRLTLTISLIFINSILHAQIINSLSKDKTGFYTHALDSCISIWKVSGAISKIYLIDEQTFNFLPDTLQGIPLIRSSITVRKKKRQKKNLQEGEVLVKVSTISIIRDEVKLGITSPRYGDWLYIFYYYYRPDTKDYYLKKIKRGIAR